jgi:tRNA U38,U39,U40 pseudouridine synthase TruA
MNNNRLSTSLGTTVNREELDDEINRLLREPSNIEIKQGRKYIKSLEKHITASSRSYENFLHAVQVIDAGRYRLCSL